MKAYSQNDHHETYWYDTSWSKVAVDAYLSMKISGHANMTCVSTLLSYCPVWLYTFSWATPGTILIQAQSPHVPTLCRAFLVCMITTIAPCKRSLLTNSAK